VKHYPVEKRLRSSRAKAQRFQIIQRHHAIFIFPCGAFEIPIFRFSKVRLNSNPFLVESTNLPERSWVSIFGGSSRVLESKIPIGGNNIALFSETEQCGDLVVSRGYTLTSCETVVVQSDSQVLWAA
jgi:hypothetical protein